MIVLLGLGVGACHGDTRLATDVEAQLLTNPTVATTISVTVKGTVSCASCAADEAMTVFVDSSDARGLIGHDMFDRLGAYAITGAAYPGEALQLKVIISKGSSAVKQEIALTVPNADGAVVIQKDVAF